MGRKMGLLESAWPPVWLNLWLLIETCISPLVVSFRGTLPTFQPCILPLPHDCSVTSQPPHIKCSLHLSRWAGSSIFWECPLFPPTFSCSLHTVTNTETWIRCNFLWEISPNLHLSFSTPHKIHSFIPTFMEASLRCWWIKTSFCPHGSYILEGMRGIS